MAKYIIDTHALVWFFTEDSRLPKRIFDILRDNETEVIIPSIVLAEFMYIARKLPNIHFGLILKQIKLSRNCVIYPLNLMVIEEMLKINKALEMHDLIIVAAARLLGVSILTKDKEIQDAYSKTIW